MDKRDRDRRDKILLKEYELCQVSVQHLDSMIWKTSAGMGFGSLGTLALLGGLKIEDWRMALPIGLLVVSATWIWWLMATRWWDVTAFKRLRMRHIEEDLKMYQTRYVSFAAGSPSVLDTDLPLDCKKELLKDPKVSRRGVRKAMQFFPPLVSVTWIIYILFLV